MFNLGLPEVILILVIVLVVFGPAKLPEIGKAVGKSIKEFKEATSGVKQEVDHTVKAASLDTPPVKESSK